MCLAGLDAQSVLQKFGKGKPIPAVIEAVSSGSTLKATLLPEQYYVEVHLVAVSCPSMNNRRPSPGAGPPYGAPAANGHAPAAAAEAADQTKTGTAGTAAADACSNLAQLPPSHRTYIPVQYSTCHWVPPHSKAQVKVVQAHLLPRHFAARVVLGGWRTCKCIRSSESVASSECVASGECVECLTL